MGVKHLPLLVLGIISAPVLVACGADGSANGAEPFTANTPSTPAGQVPNVTPPTAPPVLTGMPDNRVSEGNPAVTAPLGSGPTTGSPTTGSPTTGTPVTGPPVTGPVTSVPTPGEAEPTDCVIPAPSLAPIGYGAATTGGGNANAVVVGSFAEAEAALAAYRAAFKDGTQNALVLRYTGRFDFATITDVCAQHTKDAQILELKEMSNVTFQGAPGSSANFGLHINRAKNVIVRNMTMGLLPGGDSSDAITVEGNGTNGDVENVWLDHNELFSSTKDDCDGAGDTEFDGLIDIKKGARRITVSYNYLHDHQKTGLMGFSDTDDTERYVTFHHNRYENVVSRTPLQRFGFIHAFNNYYGQILSSGINVRMGGVALIESNFFENAANPVTSRYSDGVGFWDLRNNHVGPGITWTVESDTLANADTWQSTTSFPAAELNYSYTPDRAGCVKQIVLAQAGAKL
jgi:pectate lyase